MTREASNPVEKRWYHLVSYFFGGAVLANVFPHFVQGISGFPFQSPFATPPGEGVSSSFSNVGWALINLFIAYLLLVRVGRFDLRNNKMALAFGAGFVGMALQLAHYFAHFHGG